MHCDTITYDLADLGHNTIAEWKTMKKNNTRKRQMRLIRKKAEKLVWLKRELSQMHKLSKTENGFLGICWWHLGYWDKVLGLQIKKEEPVTPTLKIEVESPPTSNLQYPSSPPTPLSCYCSLDPNNIMDWGDLATA